MTVCDDGHHEIVYTVKRCPLCAAQIEIENLNSELVDIKNIGPGQ